MTNKLDLTQREVTVTSQEELDSIPVDYDGRIYIEFGSPLVVNKRYKHPVEARGNSSVTARGNSSVEARENSSVTARGNSSVEARENSSVEAWGNSSVEAWGNSFVVARGNSSVEARENSFVVARGNSSVVARGNSSVVARDYSSVKLDGFAHAVKLSPNARCTAEGLARVLDVNANIEDFMAYHSIEHTKTHSIWYKAVHKRDGRYVADYDSNYTYEVKKTAKVDRTDTDRNETCGVGLHIAGLQWALDYGSEWNDLAILEVSVKTADIILPFESDGKVRVPELKVIREVPLEECGLYGRILAGRRGDA